MSTTKYKNFTLSLALFDAIPVIFFSAAMLIIAAHFDSVCFRIGAILCTFAGLFKVIWKILVAGKDTDIPLLNKQLRVLMPAGFLLILIGLIVGRNHFSMAEVFASMISFPSVILFAVTIICMTCMGIFACKLDSTKARSNWIEQITNAIGQGCLLLGILFCFH